MYFVTSSKYLLVTHNRHPAIQLYYTAVSESYTEQRKDPRSDCESVRSVS